MLIRKDKIVHLCIFFLTTVVSDTVIIHSPLVLFGKRNLAVHLIAKTSCVTCAVIYFSDGAMTTYTALLIWQLEIIKMSLKCLKSTSNIIMILN